MPFIYHSKKQSIFVRKPQLSQSEEIYQRWPDETQQNFISISLQLCRDHPFRKFSQPNQEENITFIESQKQQEVGKSQLKNQKSRIYKLRPPGSKMNKNTASMGKLELTVVKDHSGLAESLQSQPKSTLSSKQTHQSSIFKKPLYSSQQRLAYNLNETPGPGSYNTSVQQKTNSASIYPSLTRTFPLPQQDSNPLLEYAKSLQKTQDRRISERRFNLNCSYKNQNSPCFKSSVLGGNKNSALLGLLFSNKAKHVKNNQCQITRQSRITKNNNAAQRDDEYIKVEQKSPSPFSYNPQKFTTKTNKQAKVFISGSPKFSDLLTFDVSPGPGHYQGKQTKNGQSFDQNQNKQRPNKFPDSKSENTPKNYVFSSSIPRELDFGMGEKGIQQPIYSPKTTMVDSLKQKQSKSSLSNKFYFGSSLQRFGKMEQDKSDPFKYSFAKLKILQSDGTRGGVVLSSKGRRELFSVIDRNFNPSPFTYNNDTYTLQKSAQQRLQKVQLQWRYNQQIVQLRQKKQHMERVLVEERKSGIDLKSTEKTARYLYPDSYKEYLMGKKAVEKSNIVFGYNKDAKINRGIKPNVEVDGYYDTEPGWEVRSFNKQYGYDIDLSCQ